MGLKVEISINAMMIIEFDKLQSDRAACPGLPGRDSSAHAMKNTMHGGAKR